MKLLEIILCLAAYMESKNLRKSLLSSLTACIISMFLEQFDKLSICIMGCRRLPFGGRTSISLLWLVIIIYSLNLLSAFIFLALDFFSPRQSFSYGGGQTVNDDLCTRILLICIRFGEENAIFRRTSRQGV